MEECERLLSAGVGSMDMVFSLFLTLIFQNEIEEYFSDQNELSHSMQHHLQLSSDCHEKALKLMQMDNHSSVHHISQFLSADEQESSAWTDSPADIPLDSYS